MKDTPEQRAKLQEKIAEGAEASRLLKQLDPKFVELRELYRSHLVHSVRTKASQEEIQMDACRITALEDLYESLGQDALTGKRAQELATQLEAEAT